MSNLKNVLKNMNISNTKFLEILGLNPHFLDANLELEDSTSMFAGLNFKF